MRARGEVKPIRAKRLDRLSRNAGGTDLSARNKERRHGAARSKRTGDFFDVVRRNARDSDHNRARRETNITFLLLKHVILEITQRHKVVTGGIQRFEMFYERVDHAGSLGAVMQYR